MRRSYDWQVAVEQRVSKSQLELLFLTRGRIGKTLCGARGWSCVRRQRGWKIRIARGKQHGRARDCVACASGQSAVYSRRAAPVLYCGRELIFFESPERGE